MKFRIAKMCDLKDLVDIHYGIRDTYSVGIFAQLGKSFFKQYYRIILNDPNEIIVCAIDENNIMQGFCSATLDIELQMANIKKHKIALGFSAITSIIKKPLLIRPLIERYKIVDNRSDAKIISMNGARSEYWVWKSIIPDSISSVEMYFALLNILKSLGVKIVSGEVDKVNKKVLAFQRANGFKIIDEIKLSDGRERFILACDLTKWNLKI